MRLIVARSLVLGLLGVAAFGLLTVPTTGAEPPVDLEGRLEIVHDDDFSRGHANFRYWLVTDANERVELRFNQSHPALPQTEKVRVRGGRNGNVVAVEGSAEASGNVVAATTGAKTAAIILMNFADNPSQPYTPATAAGIAFNNAESVKNYYAEVSGGQLTLTGDVFGWFTIPNSSATCDYNAWGTAADAAAAAAGVNLSAYTYKAYAFPSTASCGWAGLAYLPGTRSWLNGNGGMSLRVMSHEWGHNFGTHHSSTVSCTEGGVRVPLTATGTCSLSEYGDPFTVMGSSQRRHHTNFSDGNFGWLTAGNTQDVTTAGTYTLEPSNPASTGVQALRVLRSAGSYFVLEYRENYGVFDNFVATDPAVNGVSVRLAPGYSTMSQSQLIDTTPATTSFADAPLGVGQSVFDPVRGVTFTTVSVASSGAVVNVSFAPDAIAPTAPASISASATSATSTYVSWSASTDNLAVAGYRLFRNGVQIASPAGTTYTDTGLAQNTAYSYYVQAFDSANNVSGPSPTANVTTPVPDTIAPTWPAGNVLTLAKLTKPTRARLTWQAASDNVGVTAYRVYRNGSLIATVTGGVRTYDDRPPKGSFTYTVIAVDAAGNTSPASNTVNY